MDEPPYDGQGKPIPSVMGLEGAWIKAETIFICTKGAPDHAFTAISAKGNGCVGLEAQWLAEKLDTTVAGLLDMNRSFGINASVTKTVPQAGAARAFIVEVIGAWGGFRTRLNISNTRGTA
jgi:hypothetical protein